MYQPGLLDKLFVIVDLWKVINKGDVLEDEAWSSNIKIKQALDTLTSYPNEFWKYPVDEPTAEDLARIEEFKKKGWI